MATLYISPTGTGDGSSIENAGSINTLENFISLAGPGGQVHLIADQGDYNLPLTFIRTGGDDGEPVTIRGVDSAGNDMQAHMVGSGNEGFRLLNGADNLVFEDMSFSHFGNGVFRFGADARNITIQDIHAEDVHRFVQNYVSGENTTASIDGLTIRNVDVVGYGEGAIRLQYDTRNVLIENVHGDGGNRTGEQYVNGVHLDGTVHDVVIRDTTMENNYGTGADDFYWNGDGFTTELGTYNILFENTMASNNTDSGYDLKSTGTTLINAQAEDNLRNFRVWTDATFENPTGGNLKEFGGSSHQVMVWVGENGTVIMNGGTLSDTDPDVTTFFELKAGSTLTLNSTVVNKAEGVPLQTDSGILVFLDPIFAHHMPGLDTTPPIEPQSTLPVSVGGTATILHSFLYSYDNVSGPDQVTYTVLTAPIHGTLLLDGSATTTFTQADIDNGLVQYRENGDIVTSDGFTFTVSDEAGNETDLHAYKIAIVNTTDPVIDANATLSVSVGGGTMLYKDFLSTVALGSEPTDMRYSIVTAPVHGVLLLDGAPATTFTQAEIDDHRVIYQNNGDAATSDRFAFQATDAAGDHTPVTPFNIAIQPDGPNLIAQLYADILGRAPDPSGFGYLSSALTNGASLQDVRSALAHSQEAQGDLTAMFQYVAGRAPDMAELAGLEHQLAPIGASLQGVLGGLVANGPTGFTLTPMSSGDLILTALPTPEAFDFGSWVFGKDEIAGFDPAQDAIRLSSGLVNSFATVQADMSAVAGGTLITFDSSHSLTLDGVAPASLSAAHFRFI